MNELLQRLQQQAGLTTEQAQKSLQTIKQFVVEKFPMLAGAVDNIFPDTPASTTVNSASTAAPTDTSFGASAATSSYASGDTSEELHAATGQGTYSGTHANTPPPEKSFMDKISDYIPGQAGEKIEDFIKKAAQEADNLFKK